MQEQERVHSEKYEKLLEEVDKLRNEKEQQQKLLAQSLLLSEDARIEASLKHEITRLATENLVGLPGLSLCLLSFIIIIILYYILQGSAPAKQYWTFDMVLIFK